MSGEAGMIIDKPAARAGLKGLADDQAAPRPQARLAFVAGAVGLAALAVWRFEPAPSSPVVYEGGSLVAAGALEAALYDPASGGYEGGPSVGESFIDRTGHSCRRFAEGPVRGIACQRNGDWRVIEMRQD